MYVSMVTMDLLVNNNVVSAVVEQPVISLMEYVSQAAILVGKFPDVILVRFKVFLYFRSNPNKCPVL